MAAIIIRNIDPELRKDFHKACLDKGQTMTSRLIELIKKDVDDYKKELNQKNK